MFFSSQVVTGANCEYRKFNSVYELYTPREIDTSSFSLVKTRCPFLPITMAVPVSWHIGKIPPAEMLAFFKRSNATNRSFGELSGSFKMF